MTSHFAERRKSYFLMIGLVSVFVVLIAAAVLVFSRTSSAAPQGTVKEATIQGEIVAVDNTNHTKTITVLSSKIGNFPNDELNIVVNKNTMVQMCTFKKLAKGLNADSTATINYHELGGMAVADSVSERC